MSGMEEWRFCEKTNQESRREKGEAGLKEGSVMTGKRSLGR